MRKALPVLLLSFPLPLAAAASPHHAATRRGLDTATIERLVGLKRQLDPKEGVSKIAVPRSDLSVHVAGVHMTPAMGLTSWAAFERVGAHINIVAINQHMTGEQPRMLFLH